MFVKTLARFLLKIICLCYMAAITKTIVIRANFNQRQIPIISN